MRAIGVSHPDRAPSITSARIGKGEFLPIRGPQELGSGIHPASASPLTNKQMWLTKIRRFDDPNTALCHIGQALPIRRPGIDIALKGSQDLNSRGYTTPFLRPCHEREDQ